MLQLNNAPWQRPGIHSTQFPKLIKTQTEKRHISKLLLNKWGKQKIVKFLENMNVETNTKYQYHVYKNQFLGILQFLSPLYSHAHLPVSTHAVG
jgi:hypothetical protein